MYEDREKVCTDKPRQQKNFFNIKLYTKKNKLKKTNYIQKIQNTKK